MMSTGFRPLYWWNSFQLQKITDHAGDVLHEWYQDWGLIENQIDASAQSIVAQIASEVDHSYLDIHSAHYLNRNIYYWSGHQAHKNTLYQNGLSDLLKDYFGTNHESTITADVIKHMADDFWLKFNAAFGAPPSRAALNDPPLDLNSAFKNWSGNVIVTLEMLPFKYVSVLLPSVVIVEFMDKHQFLQKEIKDKNDINPASFESILKNMKIKLHIQLNSATVSLGDLNDIQVGDIFSIPHLLDEPLMIQRNGDSLANVYLGKIGDRKAIEFTTPIQHKV